MKQDFKLKKQNFIFFYLIKSTSMKIPLIIVLLVVFLHINPITCDNNATIVAGTWTANHATTCYSYLQMNSSIFKISLNNNITNQARMSYFLPNNTEIFGTCQATAGNLSLGLITTTFSCDTTSSLFQYVQNPVVIQWDAYNAQAMILITNQSMTIGNTTTSTNCTVIGNNLSVYFESKTWRVDTCVCYPCCYKENTTFNIIRASDIYNYPAINMTGTIQGPWCENTMMKTDQCALNATDNNTDQYPFQIITDMKCNYTGNLQTTQLTYWNGTVTLNWGISCQMTAVPITTTQTWGKRNLVLGMVWVI